MFYSSSTGGFYSEDLHGDGIPKDAVEISDNEYRNLLFQQELGHRIVSDKEGKPIAIKNEEMTAKQKNDSAIRARLSAYREESDPIFFMAQRGECDIKQWQEKIQEIKKRHPKTI